MYAIFGPEESLKLGPRFRAFLHRLRHGLERDPAARLAGLVAALFLAALAIRFSSLSRYFSAERLIALFSRARHTPWGPAAFVFAYAFASLVVMPASALSLAGGVLFGFEEGTLYNLAGANLGASLGFWLSRWLGRKRVEAVVHEKKMHSLEARLRHAGFRTLLRLRLLPFVPFNVFNFAAGVSSVRYRDFFFATLLTTVPACFIYSYFADALVFGTRAAGLRAMLHLTLASLLLLFLSFLPSMYGGSPPRRPPG